MVQTRSHNEAVGAALGSESKSGGARAMTQRQRDARNLKPHAEARLAMNLWSHEYAFEQSGGSMDFWDKIGLQRQRRCKDIVSEVLADYEKNGRAP